MAEVMWWNIETKAINPLETKQGDTFDLHKYRWEKEVQNAKIFAIQALDAKYDDLQSQLDSIKHFWKPWRSEKQQTEDRKINMRYAQSMLWNWPIRERILEQNADNTFWEAEELRQDLFDSWESVREFIGAEKRDKNEIILMIQTFLKKTDENIFLRSWNGLISLTQDNYLDYIPPWAVDNWMIDLVTRKSLERQIETLKTNRLETWVTQTDSWIDSLWEKIKAGQWEYLVLRQSLIEARIGMSGLDNNSDASLLLWESLWEVANFREIREFKDLTPWEDFKLTMHNLNIARTASRDAVKLLVEYSRSGTTSKIFQFWVDREALQERINRIALVWDKKGKEQSKIRQEVLSKIDSLWAIVAWAWDGVLDFTQATIDVVLVPDQIVQNVKDAVPHFADIMKTIGLQMENEADQMYVVSYVATVYFLLKFTADTWAPWVIKNFFERMKSIWIPKKVLEKTGEILKNSKVWEALTKGGRRTMWWAKEMWDKFDAYNTLAKQFIKEKEALVKSWKALKIATDTATLASIFGEKVAGTLDKANNTDIALKVYEEEILKDNWFLLQDIDSLIFKSSGELKYNFIRIKERFAEIREVMENEVMPIRKTLWDRKVGILEKLKLKSEVKKSDEYNELTKLIVEKYKE